MLTMDSRKCKATRQSVTLTEPLGSPSGTFFSRSVGEKPELELTWLRLCAPLSSASHAALGHALQLSEGLHFPAPRMQRAVNMCEEVLSCLATMSLGSGPSLGPVKLPLEIFLRFCAVLLGQKTHTSQTWGGKSMF